MMKERLAREVTDTTATPSLTSRVCRFVSGLDIGDIPEEIRHKVKLHILDTLGCGIAGASSTLAVSMRKFIGLEHGDGNVPVFGTPFRLGPAAAAFANSAAMNALDYDDGVEIRGKGMGHPGASIVAAAASAPFMSRIDGRTFLAGITAAYEINNRLIEAMQPTIRRFRDVYGVCQHQSIGSAIAHARLQGLAPDDLANVVGLAAILTHVPSLRKYNFGTPPLISFKDMNAPAAQTGVQAAQLHDCGLVGSKDVLDGGSGFWRMVGSDRFRPDRLSEALGTRWAVLNASFKDYPTCRWMHASLEAFETLMKEHSIDPESVERVVVHTSEGLARDFMDASPATMVDAQFSFPFAFAALAYGVHPASDWYSQETMQRLDLLRFAGGVRAEVDPTIDAMMRGPLRRPTGRVDIVAGGKRFNSPMVHYALGSRERPLPEDRVLAKFTGNATPVIGAAKAAEIIERIMRIEREADMACVLALAAIGTGR
jgi:2-methylcitrate dehydratase PrpD